jgi:hypothetical protein
MPKMGARVSIVPLKNGRCMVAMQAESLVYPKHSPHEYVRDHTENFAANIVFRVTCALADDEGRVHAVWTMTLPILRPTEIPIGVPLGDGAAPIPFPSREKGSQYCLMPGQYVMKHPYRIRTEWGMGSFGEILHAGVGHVQVQCQAMSLSAHSTFVTEVFSRVQDPAPHCLVKIHERIKINGKDGPPVTFHLPTVLRYLEQFTLAQGHSQEEIAAATQFTVVSDRLARQILSSKPPKPEALTPDNMQRLLVCFKKGIVHQDLKRHIPVKFHVRECDGRGDDDWEWIELPNECDGIVVIRTIIRMCEMAVMNEQQQCGSVGRMATHVSSSKPHASLGVRRIRNAIWQMCSNMETRGRALERVVTKSLEPILAKVSLPSHLDCDPVAHGTQFVFDVKPTTKSIPLSSRACGACGFRAPLSLQPHDLQCDICGDAIMDRVYFVPAAEMVVPDEANGIEYCQLRRFIVTAQFVNREPPIARGSVPSGFQCSRACADHKVNILLDRGMMPAANYRIFVQNVFDLLERTEVATAPVPPLERVISPDMSSLMDTISNVVHTVHDTKIFDLSISLSGGAWFQAVGRYVVGDRKAAAKTGVSQMDDNASPIAAIAADRHVTTSNQSRNASGVPKNTFGIGNILGTPESTGSTGRSREVAAGCMHINPIAMPVGWVVQRLKRCGFDIQAYGNIKCAPSAGSLCAPSFYTDVIESDGVVVGCIRSDQIGPMLDFIQNPMNHFGGVSASVDTGIPRQPGSSREWNSSTPGPLAPRVIIRQCLTGLWVVDGERFPEFYESIGTRWDQCVARGLIRFSGTSDYGLRDLVVDPNLLALMGKYRTHQDLSWGDMRLCAILHPILLKSIPQMIAVAPGVAARETIAGSQFNKPAIPVKPDPLVHRSGIVGKMQRMVETLTDSPIIQATHLRVGVGSTQTVEDGCLVNFSVIEQFKLAVWTKKSHVFDIRHGVSGVVILAEPQAHDDDEAKFLQKGDHLFSVSGVITTAPTSMLGSRVIQVIQNDHTITFVTEFPDLCGCGRKLVVALGSGQKMVVCGFFRSKHWDVLVDISCMRRMSGAFFTDHRDICLKMGYHHLLNSDGTPKQIECEVTLPDGTTEVQMRDMLWMQVMLQTQSADNMSSVCMPYNMSKPTDSDIVIDHSAYAQYRHEDMGAPACTNRMCRAVAPPTAQPVHVSRTGKHGNRRLKGVDKVVSWETMDTSSKDLGATARGIIRQMLRDQLETAPTGMAPNGVKTASATYLFHWHSHLEEEIAKCRAQLVALSADTNESIATAPHSAPQTMAHDDVVQTTSHVNAEKCRGFMTAWQRMQLDIETSASKKPSRKRQHMTTTQDGHMTITSLMHI